MKKAVITVLGHDKVGIIARVCTFLSEANVNILYISQTIVGGYFDMVMVVDITGMTQDFAKAVDGLASIGEEMGLAIKMQHTEIFDAMHRI